MGARDKKFTVIKLERFINSSLHEGCTWYTSHEGDGIMGGKFHVEQLKL